jgi:hypothetical protein
MLAVNNCSLEKIFPLRDGLRAERLFDPATVITWDHETACNRLRAAGYDRGPYYGSILAGRLQELATFANSNLFEQVQIDLHEGRKERVDQALLNVHGIGPAVLRNFWVLQGVAEEK